jgi:hypothetical protein
VWNGLLVSSLGPRLGEERLCCVHMMGPQTGEHVFLALFGCAPFGRVAKVVVSFVFLFEVAVAMLGRCRCREGVGPVAPCPRAQMCGCGGVMSHCGTGGAPAIWRRRVECLDSAVCPQLSF